MYARLGKFNFKPEQRAALDAMAASAYTMMGQAPGNVTIHVIIDEARGTAGTFSVWESREAHDAYHAKTFPMVVEKLKAIGVAPPYIEEYEVIAPQG